MNGSREAITSTSFTRDGTWDDRLAALLVVVLAGAVGCGLGGSASGDGASSSPALSSGGRFVVFQSYALNLAGDSDGSPGSGVFVSDRRSGAIDLVSIAPDGSVLSEGDDPPGISADGRIVVFSDNWSLYVRDRVKGSTELVSVSSSGEEANHQSSSPALSANGRFVAFISAGRNLVLGGPGWRRNWPKDTDWDTRYDLRFGAEVAVGDVFVHDRRTGKTEQINLSSSGAKANSVSDTEMPAISADGRYVAFSSYASNLAPGDTNHASDVFLRDRRKKTTVLISEGRNDRPALDPAISADGHVVAFVSADGQVFVHDGITGKTEHVSVNNRGEPLTAHPELWSAALSANGRFVAFSAGKGVFVRDRLKGTTELVSVNNRGASSNDLSYAPAISPNGSLIAFVSHGSNLPNRDTSGWGQIYVRDRARKTTTLISVGG